MLLAALWLGKGQGALWRRWIWDEAGSAIEQAAAELGGEVRPRWTGYRVDAQAIRVEWRGGLRGSWTRIRVKRTDGYQTSIRHEGLLPADRVLAIVGDLLATGEASGNATEVETEAG